MPKNTPNAIIDILAGSVKQVMNTEEFKANALKTAFPSDFQGPEEYAAYIKSLDAIYRPLWDKFGQSPDAAAPKAK
jgi:tripartite-type tricarboxylate transporter receptor subunit TctC